MPDQQLTPEQFAGLNPTYASDTVRLTGKIDMLLTVAGNALPVLDRSIRGRQVPYLIKELNQGREVRPALGIFKLWLNRDVYVRDLPTPAVTNALYFMVHSGSPEVALPFINQAIQASIDLTSAT